MKVDPRIQFPLDGQPDRVTSSRTGGAQSKGVSDTSGLSSTAGEDTLSLSSVHGQVQTLAANLAKVPEVRTDRVKALQQQVRNGQFKPDSRRVADAIVADHFRVNAKA